MPRARAPLRATHDSIGRVIGTDIPDVQVFHISRNKVRLAEMDEPFAEIILVDEGKLLVVRLSCHCAPAWAGRVVVKLFQVCDEVEVLKDPFIQAHDGRYLYGQAADDYYRWYAHKRPLLTARFVSYSDGYTPGS